MDRKRVDIFTDGACSGNPGPGGWGALLRYGAHEKRLSGYSVRTTNNRMEMLAAIRALEALKQPCAVQLVTDSNYLKQGMSQWIYAWKANDWQLARKKGIKNLDLWQRLDGIAKRHAVQWAWVRGHDGHPENEEADRLAREAIVSGQACDMPPDPLGEMDSADDETRLTR